MRTIFAEYNPHRNSIDIYTSAGYMLRIDCWEAEKDLKTTPGSDCALNALAIDKPLEYAKLYLDEAVFIRLRSVRSRIYASVMQGKCPTANAANRVLGTARQAL